MHRGSEFITLVSVILLFSLLVFTGTLIVESDATRGFLEERDLTNRQTACVDFELQESTSFQSCSTNKSSVDVFGNPTVTEGKYSRALSFDGTDDYLYSGIEYELGNFTESIWVYSENASWGHSTVEWSGRWVTKHGTNHGGFFALDENGGPLAGYRLVNAEGEKVSFVPVDIETGRWIHLTAIYNAKEGELLLYKNGEVVDSTALESPPESWTGLRFGGQGEYWFNGSLDNYRMYDEALTSRQVEALYKGEQTYYPILYSEVIDVAFLVVSTLLSLGAVYWRASHDG